MNVRRGLAAIVCLGTVCLGFSSWADLGADSPVTFPKTGALPSKFPSDQPVNDWEKPEPGQDDSIFGSPERSLAQIAKIQEAMPKGEFTLPATDWSNLAKTRKLLTEGGDLRIMAVGDSIINDTMRSAWVAKLQEAYPKAKIQTKVYVRGGGGCQYYKLEGRIAKNVVPRRPNLVILGGISQKNVESIREVIHQLRSGLPEVEILLLSGTFGMADPRVPGEIDKAPHSGTGAYGQALQKLASEEKCAYLDMTTPWIDSLRSSKLHPHVFYRDVVHANDYGEQVLSKILMAFWTGGGR